MNNGNVIVFEGPDGSGKSEVGKLVANKANSLLIDGLVGPYQEARSHVSEHTPFKGKYLFYLAANLDLSKQLESESKNNNIICVRYYYSTLVDYASRLKILPEELQNRVGVYDTDFFQPNLTILLHVNSDKQRERINFRNKGNNTYTDKLALEDFEYQKNVTENYLKVAANNNWVVLDTSNIFLDEVVEKAEKIINQRKY